jgi:predicted HicB family RNase H-like nuclease
MTTVTYKNFQGSVEFEDGHLVIQILHIDDFVTTQVDSASEVKAAFEELVDDYIETCRQLGKDPCKPFKGSFNVRIKPELHRQVAMAAADTGDTMNAWVETALEAGVERQRMRKVVFDRQYALRVLGSGSVTASYTFSETVRPPGNVVSLAAAAVRRRMN